MVESINELQQIIGGVIAYLPESREIYVQNKERVWADDIIDRLVEMALFTSSEQVRIAARRIVIETARQVGIEPDPAEISGESSIDKSGWVIPVFHLPGVTYDAARAVLHAAEQTLNAEIPLGFAVSDGAEQRGQTSMDYAIEVIGAMVKEMGGERSGRPVRLILQGVPLNPDQYEDDPAETVAGLADRVEELAGWGFNTFRFDMTPFLNNGDGDTAGRGGKAWIQLRNTLHNRGITGDLGIEFRGNALPNPDLLTSLLKELDSEVTKVRSDENPDIQSFYPDTIQLSLETLSSAYTDSRETSSDLLTDLQRLTSTLQEAKHSIGFAFSPAELIDEGDYTDLLRRGILELHFGNSLLLQMVNHQKFPKEIRDALGSANGQTGRNTTLKPVCQQLTAPEIHRELWRMKRQKNQTLYTDFLRDVLVLLKSLNE